MIKEEKIRLVMKAFLSNPKLTIVELSKLPELEGISKSCIQRYLNDPIVSTLFDEELQQNIKNILALKGLEARKKGGLKSFQNNTVIKGSNGQFIGVESSPDNGNINRKIRHILIFAQLFLAHPAATLQDIADLYNANNPDSEPVTRDYVYDCLSEHAKYDIFSEKMALQLSFQLEQRRILGNINGAIATNGARGK